MANQPQLSVNYEDLALSEPRAVRSGRDGAIMIERYDDVAGEVSLLGHRKPRSATCSRERVAGAVCCLVVVGAVVAGSLWYTCALCGERLHLLGSVGPNATAAKCLDGTPGGYYLELGAEKTRWVIWLMGGGVCSSWDDCESRAGGPLGSSSEWPHRRRGGSMGDGLMSDSASDNPDFHNWSKVYVPYCSGDVWLGKETAAADPFGGPLRGEGGLLFAGHTIVSTVIDELVAAHHIDKAKSVLLTGCSAGGLGSSVTLLFLAVCSVFLQSKADPVFSRQGRSFTLTGWLLGCPGWT